MPTSKTQITKAQALRAQAASKMGEADRLDREQGPSWEAEALRDEARRLRSLSYRVLRGR